MYATSQIGYCISNGVRGPHTQVLSYRGSQPQQKRSHSVPKQTIRQAPLFWLHTSNAPVREISESFVLKKDTCVFYMPYIRGLGTLAHIMRVDTPEQSVSPCKAAH